MEKTQLELKKQEIPVSVRSRFETVIDAADVYQQLCLFLIGLVQILVIRASLLVEKLIYLIKSLFTNVSFKASFQEIEFDEIVDFFGDKRGGDKFIDKYSKEDFDQMIRQSPLGQRLDEMGYGDWYVELDLSDSFCHYMYVRTPQLKDPSMYLGFIIVRNEKFQIKTQTHNEEMNEFLSKRFNVRNYNILDIQWLSLQNPKTSFSNRKPRMPGQRYPGSGFGRAVYDLLMRVCIDNNRDGISNYPEHFHNAYLYSGFHFVDPLQEAEFNKMKDDLKTDIEKFGLAKVSWAIDFGDLYCDDKHVVWAPGEQMLPLSVRLMTYFQGYTYQNLTKTIYNRTGHYRIDWEHANTLLGGL